MTNRFFNPSLNNLSGNLSSGWGEGGHEELLYYDNQFLSLTFLITPPYDENFQQLVISKIQLRIRIIPPTPRKPNELTKTLHRD